ncbi:aldehyde dehydrogenase family protein [Actinophytocola sp. NPDC049390]|uniref:aldehyde dehydrogenase family protein n=1 Tax=Actinophytocola sp. NPDC049390 TaxID=3363894 RepID=UPI0037ABC6B1
MSGVPDSTPDQVRASLVAARAAAPVLAASSPAERAEWLGAIASALEDDVAGLVELADRETGLGRERLTGEVHRTAGQLRHYASAAVEGSYLGVTIDNGTPRLVRVNVPLGPVAVFGASNFPFAFSVLGNDTASALAAGCPVVVKAHPAHAGLSDRLARLAERHAPEGAFSLVHGFEAGRDLVTAPETAAVAFTGSQAGGLALWRLANERERVIPVYAEMGTVNPVVVTPSAAADLDDLAAGFVGSFTLGSGQFCTKPGLLFAPAGHDAANRVAHALRAAEPTPFMLTEAIASGVPAGVARLVDAGARLVATTPDTLGPGRTAAAAVLAVPIGLLAAGSPLLEECFGPVALVAEYADTGELRAALGTLPGSLAAAVMPAGDDDPDASWLVATLATTAGRVTVGDWTTGVAYTWAQHHGGPWPATSVPWATSVGAAALTRFVRPVAYQSAPDSCLPVPARADNPWRVPRRIDGVLA